MTRNRIPGYFQLERYGISPEDVVRCTLHCEPEDIHPRVVLMPSWGPDMFGEVADAVREIAHELWEIEYRGKTISLFRSGIGAPMTGEAVLALGYTPCESVVFTGSMGGLRQDCVIGDLCVVERSICGDGSSRYLGPDIVPGDCFLKPAEPDADLTRRIAELAQKAGDDATVRVHPGVVLSLDCVLPELFRLRRFADELGVIGVEMETAAVFSAGRLVGIPTAA